MPRTLRTHFVSAALAALAALGALGCVDPKGGDTGTTPIYVYDEASKSVLAWADVNAIYNLGAGSAAPSPARTISGALISNLGTLAWGGMTYNTATRQLFLVSEAGTVVRIENANTRNGALSQITDIATFTLGNSSNSGDRLSGSVFGQAAIDPGTGTLYVTETGSSDTCRIWVVANAGSIYTQAPSGTYLQNTLVPDSGGTGVAVGSAGNVMAYFLGGQVVTDPNPPFTQYTGARLRVSTGSGFDVLDNVLVGDLTLLADSSTSYGTLAFDSVSTRLYVARPVASGKAVLAFTRSQFSFGSMDQAPAGSLADDATALGALRFIAHARTKDWMAGADLVAGSGTGLGGNVLHLWKGPSTGAASTACTLGSAVQVRGLALDGSQ